MKKVNIDVKIEMVLDYMANRRGRLRNEARLSEICKRFHMQRKTADGIMRVMHRRGLVHLHDGNDPLIVLRAEW